jgi:hypothetical protein
MDAVDDGIVHLDHIDDRAVVATIGSLGNGGIVAVFAVLYYPHLPRLGTYVRILCWIGTACIVAGFATATASRSVSVPEPSLRFLTNRILGLALVRKSGYLSRHWEWHTALRPVTNTTRILPGSIGPRPGNHVCR